MPSGTLVLSWGVAVASGDGVGSATVGEGASVAGGAGDAHETRATRIKVAISSCFIPLFPSYVHATLYTELKEVCREYYNILERISPLLTFH
jgi:hypothetical protein